MPTSLNRQAYLDWLRIFAIFGVLFFHAAMPFAAEEGWHIKNSETSNLFLEFNFFMSRFRMPLLFFISGAVCFFMLKRRNASQFIGLRFKRLFIPLLFGMLVIVPPQVYMERVANGYSGSFWQFYPSIFEGKAYPAGNTSWHHLWFILYLFIYDILAVPFFLKVMKNKSQAFSRFIAWLSEGKRIYLLLLPGLIPYVLLIGTFPQTNDLIHDWAMFFYWFSFVIAGFLVISQQQLLESIVRNRRSSLLIAFISIVTLNYFRWNSVEPWEVLSNWQNHPLTYLYRSLYVFMSYSAVFALVGYAKTYLNRQHTFLTYANPAVYPFYILHQTVIVILAFYVVQVNESILNKYLFLAGVTFLLCMGIYHLMIRQNKVLRFVFGMKEEAEGRREKAEMKNQKGEFKDTNESFQLSKPESQILNLKSQL